MATEESKQIFCWGEIVREIYVSRAGDPVHAGDKALMRETPAKRGRVNRYVESGVKHYNSNPLLLFFRTT